LKRNNLHETTSKVVLKVYHNLEVFWTLVFMTFFPSIGVLYFPFLLAILTLQHPMARSNHHNIYVIESFCILNFSYVCDFFNQLTTCLEDIANKNPNLSTYFYSMSPLQAIHISNLKTRTCIQELQYMCHWLFAREVILGRS
jgi:hypothetical protein